MSLQARKLSEGNGIRLNKMDAHSETCSDHLILDAQCAACKHTSTTVLDTKVTISSVQRQEAFEDFVSPLLVRCCTAPRYCDNCVILSIKIKT